MPLLCPTRSQNSQPKMGSAVHRRDPCPCLPPTPRGWAGRSLAACSHGRRGGNKNIRSSPRVCGRGMKGPLQGRSRPVPGREVFYISSPREQRAGQGGWWEGEAAGRGACADSRNQLVSSASILRGQKSTQELPPPLDNPWFGAWGKDLLQGLILPRAPRGGTGCRSGDEGGESRRLELSAGKKSSADAPQPPARAGQGPQPPWLQHGAHRCLPGPGCAAGPGECHRSLSHPVPLGSPALSPPLLLPGAGWI